MSGCSQRGHYTAPSVRSTVEPLEGNKVKFSIEVEAEEFDRQVDDAFRRLAQQVRLPGFRPGKAPRKVLEARLGIAAARQEALRESLPDYYAEAVRTHEVDVIAPPELEITSGADDGAVAFDAVVEIRPTITISGYADLQVTVPSPVAADAEVDERVERLRSQHAEYEVADRPAADGDQVVVDIEGRQGDDVVEGLTAEDYSYELGSSAVVPEIDENLRGAKAGDEVTFDAKHPEEGEDDLSFRITVKEVRGRVLPAVDDAWVAEVTDHETVEALRGEYASQLARQKLVAANMALQQRTAEALAGLVTDELPEALIQNELSARLNNLDQRLRQQGLDLGRYLQFTGQPADELVREYREASGQAVKVDLALRAVADAEGLELGDDDLEQHFADLSRRFGVDAEEIRENFERAGQMAAVRSEIRKGKALEWLLERVSVVDEDGNPVDRSQLEIVSPAGDDDDTSSVTTSNDDPASPGEDTE